MKSPTRTLLIGGTIIASYLILGGSALAASNSVNWRSGSRAGSNSRNMTGSDMKPMIIGTVSGINGSQVTVTGKNGTTYAVDASNARISKGFGQSAQLLSTSALAVNDTVAVIGTVSGTTVKATYIRDGLRKAGIHSGTGATHSASATAHTPHIVGTITAVNGSSFTIQGYTPHVNGSATTAVNYTVTTSAGTVFMKNKQLDSLSDLTAGQKVVVSGTIDSTNNTIAAKGVHVIVL